MPDASIGDVALRARWRCVSNSQYGHHGHAFDHVDWQWKAPDSIGLLLQPLRDHRAQSASHKAGLSPCDVRHLG
jgi:hypothetical protein